MRPLTASWEASLESEGETARAQEPARRVTRTMTLILVNDRELRIVQASFSRVVVAGRSSDPRRETMQARDRVAQGAGYAAMANDRWSSHQYCRTLMPDGSHPCRRRVFGCRTLHMQAARGTQRTRKRGCLGRGIGNWASETDARERVGE